MTADGHAVLRAYLPNGVHIDLEIAQAPVSSIKTSVTAMPAPWQAVLHALALLPCSR